MGQWIGKGKWVFSSEEKEEFRRRKQAEFQAQVDSDRQKYLTRGNLTSFLSVKDVEEHFKIPDRKIHMKMGGQMFQYDYKKVMQKIKKLKLTVKRKKKFEEIRIEEFKEFIRTFNVIELAKKLDKKLPPKGTPPEKKKKI